MTDRARQVPKEVDEARERIPRSLVILAGVPLLAAMLIEFLAVLGRHIGWNLVGSIELVQALILLSSSGAMVAATVSRGHAKVNLLSRRYRGTAGRAMRILLAVGSAAFFVVLAVGSGWIALDMWGADEQSELLGVPYFPLRVVVTLATFAIAGLYGLRVARELRGR
ncbi:MAG TPA: TRAP transporter small permease subunit [Woeseiaceae bacterium]|nr:TRAP transporter small permease subunit [Woeseiaceae bacterium]